MKLAISGKGGAGKSTLAAALSLLMARHNRKVLAVDADPDANLAACLGIPEKRQKEIIPLSKQAALIEERTGAKVKQYGQIFKLNPEVSDIADSHAITHKGVALLILGAVERGGSGCACPENVLIRALISDLVLYRDDAVIMDMEAGIEHLGRATSSGVDVMLVVIEPGRTSIDSAKKIISMSSDIGLKNVQLVANKVRGAEDEKFIRDAFPNRNLLGVLPYSEDIRRLDKKGMSVLDGINTDLLAIFEDILKKIGGKESPIKRTRGAGALSG